MRKISNSTDVARLAGVSRTTVSYVLNELATVSISEETRQRVLQAAHTLQYRPNRLVLGMQRGKTQTIGVIVPRLDSAFVARIVQGLQDVFNEHGYRVLLGHTQHNPDAESNEVDLLLEHRVDGLIWVGDEKTVQSAHEWISRVVKEHIPFVIVDDRSYAHLVNCVVSNDLEGAPLCVNHLLALGHQRIAFISATMQSSSGRDRVNGYRNALKDAGLEVDESLIYYDLFNMMNPEEAVASLLDLPNPPTALFAANDLMAASIFHVLRKQNIRVPHDIALVGYADLDVAEHLFLTTVHQDAIDMGRRGALRLLDHINNVDCELQTILIPTRLVIRESCGSQV